MSWREQVNFQCNDDDVRFVVDQHTALNFYRAGSLKQKYAGRHVAPIGCIILIPIEPTNLCSFAFSLTQRA